jgi:hypothetical protein
MIGNMQSLLVDHAYRPGKRCPYAIVLKPLDGEEVIIERCDLKYGHTGPHTTTIGGRYDLKRAGFLQARIQWRHILREDSLVYDGTWTKGDVVKPEYDNDDQRRECCEGAD